MKDIFKGFYKLNENEYSILWENGIFVFDTNVLLNLYRYQIDTTNSLIKVLEILKNRIWIPYHVGLEFQRNRNNVICDQYNRFTEVKKILNDSQSKLSSALSNLQLDKRHALINTKKLLEEMDKITNKYLEELEKLEKKSINIDSEDRIRLKIDGLFEDRIGPPPKSQKDIDEIFKEGVIRYEKFIPPGFEDLSKDDKINEEFSYAGITYKKKFGDLIIWKQIIEFVKKNNIENLIFITDDNKSDWMWKIQGKTIGARPELVDEIISNTDLKRFHIYNSASFLKFANDRLNMNVKEDAIKEVREIGLDRKEKFEQFSMQSRMLNQAAEEAVLIWLKERFQKVEFAGNSNYEFAKGLDFIAYQDDSRFGFEVRYCENRRSIRFWIKEKINQLNLNHKLHNFREFAFVFVVDSESMLEEVISSVYDFVPQVNLKGEVKVIVGVGGIDLKSGKFRMFRPYADFHIGG